MVRDRDTKTNLEVLRETAHMISQAFEVHTVVQLLLHQTTLFLNAQGALVRLLTPDGSALALVGAEGLSESYLSKGIVSLADSVVDQRVLQNEIVVIHDVTKEAAFQYQEEASREGLRGMVAVPLMVRDRVTGLLRIYVQEVEDLEEEDLLILRTMADIGALAMEKIRLHQSLYRISEALNSSLEIQPMLQRVLEATVKEMELKAASIRLLDKKGEKLTLVAAHGLSERYLQKGAVEVRKSPVDRKVLQMEPVVLYDVESETGFQYPQEAANEGIRSVLVVPIPIKQRPLGVMRVYSARPRHFSLTAQNFLVSVADLVALAVENAELYQALQSRYEDLKLDLAEWYRFLALG
jgi:signal transduction protein with GAF and PtsI domain